MNYDKVKQALDQDPWSEVKQFMLDKLLELKNTEIPVDLSPENYKTTDLGVKLAHKKLKEIFSELMNIAEEDPVANEEAREKDSCKVLVK